MRKKSVHILLLEKSHTEARFVRDALAELEEMQQGNSWLGSYELTGVESWDEASILLRDTNFEVILANLWLEDTQGLETLHRLRAAARHTPVVVLTPKEDPALAIRLVQEGAAEVLVQNELDCSPLGRALRMAIERQRLETRVRSLAVRDELSGLLNFTGFVQIGESLSRPLQRAQIPANCVTFNLENLEELSQRAGFEEENWLLLECSELLREAAGEGDLLAYLGQGRFAWLCMSDERYVRLSLEEQERALGIKLLQRGHAVSLRYRIGISSLNDTTDWNLGQALEAAERESWPVRLGQGMIARAFATGVQ